MKIVAALLAIVAFFSCKNENKQPAEPDNIAITKMLERYHSASQKQNWASAIEFIHPDVFRYVSKKDFEKVLQNAMNGDGYKVRIENTDIDSIYPSFMHQRNKYALVRLRVSVEMIFTGQSDSSKAGYKIPEDICDRLRESDEANFIDCRFVGNRIKYSMKDLCYAAYLYKKKKWFFLSKDEDTEEIVNKIIPAEVREKFGY